MIASGREPSMEEILASIKKVIAEDKDARAAAGGGCGILEERRAEVRPGR
jgi:cell pole-organizing protein PopZ